MKFMTFYGSMSIPKTKASLRPHSVSALKFRSEFTIFIVDRKHLLASVIYMYLYGKVAR